MSGLNRWYSPSRRHWYSPPTGSSRCASSLGLQDKADVRSRKLSGGQLRRLDFALALVGDPELIFLDEPTTGFDPEARRSAWETVRKLRDLGKTILLTTHYLDEAQELADRVAIVKDGRVLAIGPPRELGVGASHYRVAYRDRDGHFVERQTDDPTALLNELTAEALARRAPGGAERRAPDARGRLPGADRRWLTRSRARLAPVPPGAAHVLAQSERRLLQLPAAAAVPRRRRSDPRRQPARAQPADPGDRR